MRNKIKMFAQAKVTLPPGRHKIVILDEADRLVSAFLLHNFASFTRGLLGTFAVLAYLKAIQT